MKAAKPVTLLIAAFALALAAGVSGGLLLARLPAARAQGQLSVAASPLAAELSLSPQQAEQMREIWENVRDTAQECLADARRLQRERDDALVSLLTHEQKAAFAKISQEYADGFAELNRRRDREFKKAVGQTQAVLNAEQWERYQRILRSRVGPAALRDAPDLNETQPPDVTQPPDAGL